MATGDECPLPLGIDSSDVVGHAITITDSHDQQVRIHQDDLAVFCNFVGSLPKTEDGRLLLPGTHAWDEDGQEWVVASLYFVIGLSAVVHAWKGADSVFPAESVRTDGWYSTKEAQEAAANTQTLGKVGD